MGIIIPKYPPYKGNAGLSFLSFWVFLKPTVGMFPLILTVLNGDSSIPWLHSLLRAVRLLV